MPKITPVLKKTANSFVMYYEDVTNNFESTGIVVDDDGYDLGTFLDRDYDVRTFLEAAILLQNIGANSVDYTILGATKDFDDLDNDLIDGDYTEILVAEAAIAAAVKANGTVTFASAVANTFATGTITLASAVANTFATGTVTCASVQAADTVTINGLVYTAVAGAKADNTEFSIDTSDDACAADLADSITNDTRSGTTGDQTATSSTNVVTITTDVLGAAGNAITLVSSNGTRLAVSGAGTLTGGVTADTATVNGLVYTAVEGVKADNTQFSIDTSDTAAATDLADSIDNDTRTGTLGDVSATSNTAVVTCTSDQLGTAGNAVTLVSSDAGRIGVSGAGTFTGGVTADTVTVNELIYTAVAGVKANNTQFSIDTSDTAAAADLADSITNDTRVGTQVSMDMTATSNAAVTTITAAQFGVLGNSIGLASSDNGRLAVSAANLENGADGSSPPYTLQRTTPSITAIKIRAKETAGGSPGKVRGDVKFRL